MDKQKTLEWVKKELIFKRLRLEDIGFKLEEITNDTHLFTEEGLDLNSIDGLELAVGIEQKYGVKIGKMKEDISNERFLSPSTITDFILELNAKHLQIRN